MDNIYYKIEDVANKTGLTKRAIRYYEDIKLISPNRTKAGYRLYTNDDIAKIMHIKSLRETLGFTLNEIKDTLELECELKNIILGNNKDIILINNLLTKLKKQMELINKKERSLNVVKKKYEDLYTKLSDLKDNIKED